MTALTFTALISPSQVALRAVDQRPVGAPATFTHRCALCGHEVTLGELSMPYRPSDSFTDYGAMAKRDSGHICGWCAGVLSEDRFTQQWGNAVFTPEGVFRAGKNIEIAYWLLNPPAAPYIWVKLAAKKQHLVWRAPVNCGADIIQTRLGDLVLTIRAGRPLVICCS